MKHGFIYILLLCEIMKQLANGSSISKAVMVECGRIKYILKFIKTLFCQSDPRFGLHTTSNSFSNPTPSQSHFCAAKVLVQSNNIYIYGWRLSFRNRNRGFVIRQWNFSQNKRWSGAPNRKHSKTLHGTNRRVQNATKRGTQIATSSDRWKSYQKIQ